MFDAVGGLNKQIRALKEMVLFPLMYPEVFEKFKISPPRGVLFHGPPGMTDFILFLFIIYRVYFIIHKLHERVSSKSGSSLQFSHFTRCFYTWASLNLMRGVPVTLRLTSISLGGGEWARGRWPHG